MSKEIAWKPQAFLEGLRPESGFRVDCALIATYSADVLTIAATLLALAGRDDEEGNGTRADMAEAVESLRGRVRILVQQSRFAKPKNKLGMATLFDQFVIHVPFDESKRSWHPKAVVVRYVNSDKESTWKLWLGSRNLTTTVNLDVGLMLDGSARAKRGDHLPGIDGLVRELANRSALPNVDIEALVGAAALVKWESPKGLDLTSVKLLSQGNAGYLPEKLPLVEEVVLIGPFLDGEFVSRIGEWGLDGTKHQILSTEMELRKLARQVGEPLKFFNTIAAFASPGGEPTDPNAQDTEPQDGPISKESEEEFVARGLHAKIVATRRGTKWRIWLGSANATCRGWDGTNTEFVAECVGAASLGDGLVALVKSGVHRTVLDLQAEVLPLEDLDKSKLDNARRDIAAHWRGHIRRDGELFTLISTCDQLIHSAEVSVWVGLATGLLQPMPSAGEERFLGQFSLAEQTTLLQWQVKAGDLQCSWLQGVAVLPEIDPERDMSVIAAHLGAEEFAAWIRSLLRGETGEGWAKPWDTLDPPDSLPSKSMSYLHLNLEEVLACRGRDPTGTALREVDARVQTYLAAVIKHAKEDTEAVRHVLKFGQLWALIRKELVD